MNDYHPPQYSAQIEAVEVMLLEYIEKYGLTEKARTYFIQKEASEEPLALKHCEFPGCERRSNTRPR